MESKKIIDNNLYKQREYNAYDFYNILADTMRDNNELYIKQIYSLFPDINPKTISWRLYDLVQQGKLYKTGHGYYSINPPDDHLAAGYQYLQKRSQQVYDIAIEFGYHFYISGLDALVGEMLHIPETYPVLLVVEESGIKDMQEVLNEKQIFAITEKEKFIIKRSNVKNLVDVLIIKGKDFSLSNNSIALKEKGFVDLYYAVTRLHYGIDLKEMARIYQSMVRNKTIYAPRIKKAAKEIGVETEINWLLELNKFNEKTLDFMEEIIRETIWKE